MDNSQASQTRELSLADKAEEVRAYVVAMRGGAPFLSGADGRLLVQWLSQGIPVARILAAVDEVAEKRRKKRTRSRLTLTGCKRSIEGTKNKPMPPPSAAVPSSKVDLRTYAGELAAMDVDAELAGDRDKLIARIGTLSGDAEWVATEAVAACRAFQHAAWSKAQSDHGSIRAQAEAELSALKNVLKPDALQAYIDEVARDIVMRRTPLVSAKAVWDRVSPS